MAGAGAAPQAGVTNTQAHGKHIDFPGLIAQQPALSYQATLICNSAPGGSVGPGAAGGFTGPDGDTGVRVQGTLGCGFRGRSASLASALLSILQLLKSPSLLRWSVYTDAINLLLQLFTL